jgi:serine/threonine-protein kinase ULK/ATG1
VAIKIYEKYKLIDEQVKQNLVRDIKVLSKLNHPNNLRFYESIDTFSNVYLITEYVEGAPLNEYVKKSAEKLKETGELDTHSR